MRYLLIAVFFSIVMNGQESTVNLELKEELKQIDRDDQMYRELMQPNVPQEQVEKVMKEKNLTKEDVTVGLGKIMDNQDIKNMSKIEKIIKKYGYPGKSLVGEPENTTVWRVIQHSPEIEKYLPVVKAAVEKKEIGFYYYAIMLDRNLMQQNKEQIYGTQGTTFETTVNGKPEYISLIWPIKDFQKVNDLRKKAGFNNTVEIDAKSHMGNDFVFKNYTLEEVLKLQSKK